MKIKTIVKVKDGYDVYTEDGKFFAYEDVLLKYDLLIKKRISDDLSSKISHDNEIVAGYKKCLHLLKRKRYSSYEIKNLLQSMNYTSLDSEEILNRLIREGYVDDEKYAESFLNDLLLLSLKGPLKIKKMLDAKGIDPVHYEDRLSQIEDHVWQERMQKIVTKKLQNDHRSSITNFKEKMKQYLYQEGYSYDMQGDITSFLPNNDRDETIIKSELIKAKKALDYKYQGKELQTKLRMRLYRKGFSLEQIDRALEEIENF